MTTFLRPNKSKLKNAQHFEFIDAFITLLVAATHPAAVIHPVVATIMEEAEVETMGI
jgi:hypothetical protein